MKLSISASVTTTRLSTSRSRRRVSRISVRISSRKRFQATPSVSSVVRSCSTDSLLLPAMRSIARSSVASSTRSEVSCASWTCARSTIRRSSNWRSSTLSGGSSTPWRASWRLACSMRARSCRDVITSLLTTATMRSTSTARGAAWTGMAIVAAARPMASATRVWRKRRVMYIRCGFAERDSPGTEHPVGGGVVDLAIAWHAALDQAERVGADAGEVVEFELDEDGVGDVVLVDGEAVHRGAEHPAATVVFQAGDGFGDAVVLERMRHAADTVPVARDRPLAGDIDVFQADNVGVDWKVGRVSVAEVQRSGKAGLIADAGIQALGAAGLGIELHVRVDRDPLVDLATQ